MLLNIMSLLPLCASEEIAFSSVTDSPNPNYQGQKLNIHSTQITNFPSQKNLPLNYQHKLQIEINDVLPNINNNFSPTKITNNNQPKTIIKIDVVNDINDDDTQLITDMMDLIFFNKEDKLAIELEPTGQFNIGWSTTLILKPHAFTYNTISDEIGISLDINPFYRINYLDMIDIRFEMFRYRISYLTYVAHNPAHGRFSPMYNSESVDILYNLIKKEFLTFYVGYAIYSRYDALYMIDGNFQVQYQSGVANSFLMGTNLKLSAYTFFVAEYRITTVHLAHTIYNDAVWNMGLKVKAPIIN